MPLVVLDQIRGHLQRRIDDDPLGDLLGQRRVDPHLDLGAAVPQLAARRAARTLVKDVERAGREVHRAAQQAREGQHHLVRRRIAGRPGVPLLAAGTLARHHIGPRAADAAILDGFVGVDRDAVRRSGLHHLLVVAHAVLAVVQVAVGESAGIARLEVAHPLLGRPGERMLQLPLVVGDVAARLVVVDHLDAPFARITHDLGHVEIGIGLGEVERLTAAPALPALVPSFEQHALDVVGRREVDVALGVLGRGAVAVVHRPALDAQVHAPPDAHVLHRADPARILDLRGFIEVENQRRVDQIDGPVAQLDRPPGGDEAARHAGLRPVGQRRQLRREGQLAGLAERHLGIVVERRLVDASVHVSDPERRGGIGVGQLRERQFAVEQLVGLEAGRDGPRIAVGREAELGLLGRHRQRIGIGHLPFVAEPHAVVECPEPQRQPHAPVGTAHFDGHLVVTVAHRLVLAPRLGPGLVGRGAAHPGDLEIGELRLARLDAERRGADQRVAVAHHGIGHRGRIERNRVPAVGRRQFGNGRAGRTAAGDDRRTEYDLLHM